MLLTIKETAALLHVSVSTLRRMWADGLAPKPIRLGRRGLRWRRTDIEDFIRHRPAVAPRAKATAVEAR